MQLQGIIPALTTPFDAQGELALDRLRENIAAYNRTGLSGHLAVGSTGESVLLDRIEFERVLAAVREAAAPELQQPILQASNRIVGAFGIPGVKYAMDQRGYYGGPARRSLLPLSEAQKREVESALAATSPLATGVGVSSAPG